MAKQPTKDQLRKIADKTVDFVTLKHSHALMEKQLEAMKKEIGVLVEPFSDQFKDGAWIILHPDTGHRVGQIQAAHNKPKLVLIDSDRELTDQELKRLMKQVPKRYTGVSLNIASMNKNLKEDEALVAVLDALGITVVQARRYDVKA